VRIVWAWVRDGMGFFFFLVSMGEMGCVRVGCD